MEPKDYTVEETAARIGCSRDVVRDLVVAGRLAGAYHIGAGDTRKHWRIPSAAVDALMRARGRDLPAGVEVR